MAGKRIEVQLGINADVAAAKKSIKDLEISLSKLYQAQSQRGFEDFGINKAVESAQKLEQSLHRALNVDTGKLDLSKFSTSLKQAGTSLTELNTQFLQAGTAGQQVFLSLANSIAQAEVPLKKTSRLVQEFSRTLKNTVSYQLSASMFNAVTGALHDAVSYTKNLNGSLNEIRIVTGQSAEQMVKFAQSANAAAKQLSTTTNDYAKASLIFYQQGLSDAEVKKRTDAVIKMANVTKESADDVSSYMTAIWNNFDDGSKSLERYADVMTALGAATASSTKEIAAGLEKFASIGKTIGLSYEYATSAVATIVDKTRQSAETVGTGLRTIFSRLQGLSLGETLEDGVNLNKYSAALKTVGVNILDASGNMQDMDAILESLADKWQNLSTAQKTALAQTVGGVRQYTTLISLMDNWDSMERNLNTANTSAGSLQKQQDIYAESWEAASERSKAALEGLYQTLLNDKGFITLINGLTGVTEAVTVLANALGGLPGILGMVGMISTKVFSNQISSGIQTAITNLSAWYSQFKGQGFFKSLGLIGSGQSKSAAQMKAKNEAQKIATEYDKQMQSMKQAGKQDTSAYYAASAAKELLAAKTDLLNVENQLSDIQKKNAQDQIVLMGKQQQALLELKQEKEQMAKDDKKQAALDERQVLNSISYDAGGGYIRDDKEQAAAILKGKFNNNIMNIRTGYEQATYKKTMAQKFKSYAGSIDGNDAAAMAQLRSGINDVFGAGSVAETDGLKEILSLLAQIESKAQRAEDRIDAAVKSADGGAQGALRNLGTNGRLAGEANASVDYEKWFKEGQYRRTQGQFQQRLKGEGQKGDGSKVGEKIAAGAQTAMQAVSALTSGITQAQSAMETFGDSGATAGEKIAAGMSIASGAATAFATGGWIGLAAYAVGSIGMVLYQAIDDAYHAEEIAADKAEQAASALAESYKNVKAEYDNVLSTVESYESASESLDALVIGTDEWKEALIEANEAALKLIDNFNLIKGEDYTVNTDGSISFTKAGQSKIDDGQTQMLNDTIAAQSAASLAQAEAAQARAEANKDVTTKSNDKGRWATAAGLGGGYALAGGMIGAAGGPIGAAIGAILGGAIGFLGGLWAYDHDQEIINNAEKAKIDDITEIYKKNKNDTELEQLINEQFANESESYRQSIMDIVKTTVEASEQLSDAMALAAQSSLNANKTYQNMKDAEAQADVSARAAQVYEAAYNAEKEAVKAGMEDEEKRKQYANAYEAQLRKQYGESVEVGEVNSDGSFSYTYLDENHQRQTAEVMASEVVTYMATQAGQSAISDQIDQWAQVFGDWRSGSKDERAMAAFGGQGLRTATKEELDALNSDYKSYFSDLTSEELAALGYESAEAAIAAFEEQMGGDTGIAAAWEKAISGMGDIDTSFIEKMSLETAQKFTNSIKELSNGPIQNVGQILNDGLAQAFNEANVKEADKSALLAQIADIDWSDYDAFDQFVAIFESMGYSIDEASAYWTGFTANMRQAGTAIPDFTKLKTTLSSIAKITQDLKLGDIVSEEDYKALIDYNSAWEDFFVLQADGSRKFIGDADSMRAATQQMALEQKALLDSYKEVSDIEAVQDFNWSDTSGEGTVKSDFLGIYDANIALQEMLTTAGYTRDQIVSIFDAAATGDTAALETLFSFIQKATDPAQMSQATTDLEEMIASTATSVEELQSMLADGTISQETYSKSLLSMASGYEYCAEAVKNYQEALANGEGIAEAQAILERTVALEQEAAKYGKAYQNAMSGRSSVSIEDLTALQEAAPELYDQFLTMSDAEWVDSAYEHYSAMLEARIASYPKDSAAYREAVMEKRELDEEYYSALEERAESALNSVREHQEGLRDAISGASDALDGLLEGKSFNELGKAEVANLIQSLREVGYSAEEIDRILKNLGKDEEQSSTASMLAAARAKTQLMLAEIGTYKQEQASYESLGAEGFNATEANTTITVDADVQSPLKTEGDSIVPQTTPGESTIEVSLDSQNATYNPETGDIYVKSADGLITYRFDVDNVAQAFDPDTGLYTLTDPKTGKIIYQFNLNNAPSSFDPDTGKVTILDPETGTIDYQFDIKDLSAAFDPDTGEYTLTDPDTGAIAYAFNINDTVGAFDPEKGTYTLYDSTTGQLKYSFSVTNETAAFDPTTGKYTLTDATTGKIIYTTTVNTNSTTFDPTTGSILITTPEGHTIPYKVEVDNNASTFDAASGKLVVVDADGKKVPYTVDVSNGVYNPATKQIEFTDASGNKVSYSVDGAEGFVYDEATNSFTFANSDGTVNYSVAAASGYVYDKESNTWKFNPSAVTANVGLEGDDLPEDGEERTVTVYVKTVDTSIDEVIASQEALQAAVGKAGYDYWGSLGKTGWFDAGFNNTWNDIVDSKFNVAQYLATHDNGEAELRSMSGAIGKELQRQLEEEFGGDMSAALANESWATGYNLYLGLIKGYQAAGGEAANMVGPVNGALLAQINSDLGVQSPSKYTKETGHWLMAGLVEGFAETPFEATGLAGKVMGAIQEELADVSPGDALKAIEDELFGIDNGTDAEGNPIIRGTELTSEEKANYLAQKGYKIQANEDGTFQAYTIDSEGNVQKAIGEAYETFDQAYLTLVTDMFSEKRMADYLSGGYMTSGDFDAIEQGLIKEALENGFKEWKAKNPDSGFETLDELLQSGDPHVVGDFYDNYFTPAVANGAQTLQDAMSMAYANIQDEWITTLKNVNKATDEAAKQMYDSWMTTFEALSDAYAAIFSGENLSESLSKESQRALIDGWLKEGYTPDEIRDMMLNKDSVSIDDLSMQDYANSGSQQGGAAVGFDYNADGTVKETSYTQWEANMRAHYQRQADQFASTEDMVAADTQAAHKEYLTWMGQGLNFDQILAEKGITRDKYDSDEAYQAAVKAVQAGMADAQTLADIGFYERNEDGTYVTTDELSEAVKTGYVDAMMAGHGATAAEREQVYLDAYGNLIANDIEYRQGMRDRYSGARDAAVSKLEEDRDLVNKAMKGEALSPEEQARVDALVKQYGSLEDANIGLASTIDQTIAAFNRMIAAIDAGYTNLGDGVWGKKKGETTITQHEGQYDTLEAASATGLLTDGWTDADGDGVYSKTMAVQDPETGKYYIVTHTSEMETMSEDSEEFEALAPEGTQHTDNAYLEAAQAAGFSDLAEQDSYIREAETRTIIGVNGEEKNLMATEDEIIMSEMEGQLAQTVEGWNDLTEAEQNNMAAEKAANLTTEERAELLKEAEKRQRKYANELKKMEKAYDRLAKEGRDLLKTANDEEASMSERVAAVDGLREIYTDILGPMDKVGDAFVKNADNMKLAEEAAAGNEESLNKLQVAYLEALAGVDFQGPLQDLAAEVAAWDPEDLEVGATIDDTDFLAKCAELVNKAGLTADQASDALSAMGVDAEIEEHEVPIGEDGTTEIQAQGTIYVPKVDENGNVSYEAVDATGGYTIEGESGQTVKYYTIKGAKYNGKGVTGGGGGGTGGGRRGGGGGGGGGGRRDPRRANHVKKEDYAERYHEIDNVIDDLADAYERLNKEEDRAWGKNRIDAMKEQTKVIKDQIAATEEKIRQAKEYLEGYYDTNGKWVKGDRQAAEDMGWEFDADGNVSNYDEFMEDQVNKYNAAIDAYNGMSAEAQEELDKKYQDMKNEDGEYYSGYEDYLKQTLLDDPKEALEQYEETMELLEDLGMDYDDLLNEWHDNIIGQIQTKLDTTLEVTEAQLGYLEHKLSRIEDDAYSAAEAIGLMGQQMDIAQTQFNAHKSALDDLLKAYSPEGTVWSAEDLMNGNISSEDLVNAGMQSGDIELIQTIMEGMMDASEQMSEQMVNSIEHMANAFEEFNADMDRYISTVEHAQAITSTYRNIIDLTGRTMSGFNSTMLKSINDAIAAQSVAKLEANKTKYETVKTEYDEAKAAYEAAQQSYAEGGIDAAALKAAKETYQTAQDNMNEAQEAFLSSWEEALQAAADAFQSNMEAAVRDIGEMMSGGLAGGLAELEDAFAKMNERDQNYVDDYEKIYQLTKMTRDLTDKIDSTSNIRAQKELLKYQKELNGLLESDQEMSAYDLDYLQKKLDLKLAEIALDEAQNAKSQVTMRRDSEGNYNYVYTADENAVEKAESDYADRLYEMQKANDEYITGLSENMANLSSQMLSEIAAIDTTIYDTEEKYQAEVQRITDHYTSQMEYYNSEMNKVLGNNKTLYEQDWTNFSKYTGYKLSAEENYVTKWNQTVLSQVTGFETQEEFYQNFNEAVFGGDPAHPSGESLIGRLVTAYKTMREQIAAANAAAGVETEDLATALLGNIEAATQEAEAAADGITEAATEIVTQITSIGDAVTNMVNNYSQAMATMEAETDAMLGVLLDFLTAYGEIGDLDIDPGVLAEIEARRRERQENPEGYDTGGYTGAWGSEGRLAYLHQKELVLNAEDTANMLASVGILRQIANVIDLNALASAGGFISLMSSGVAGNQGTLQQEVHIEASFPAVTDKNQIEEAFGDLVNLAAQYANRKL